MQNKIDLMYELIEDLNKYTKSYDEGNPEISDEDWDNMYFELQTLEEETGITLSTSPTIHIDYQVVNKLNKVTHNHPMLSLDKTKSVNEVLSFLNNKDSIAMAKMDGLTCSLSYKQGLLVGAETRGNGFIGEDILQNIVFVKGVPLEIPLTDNITIDGEIICTYNDFKEFSDEYKNPRNFASGSIRLLDSKESSKRKLTFVAWDCIKGLDNCKTLTNKLLALDELGFIIVPMVYLPELININQDTVEHAITLLKNQCASEEFSYPIDGIVFKYNNCEYYESLGATEHHFRGGLAYKFYDEEYETSLLNIEWTMGKTGQLTPTAIFEPIDDGESIIERASLHNISIMQQTLGNYPYAGQKIYVAKMNMIIPQVTNSEKNNELNDKCFNIPTICPVCGGHVTRKGDFLYCDNSECDGKLINRIDYFVGKKGLDIKGLSKLTLAKLIDFGWINNFIDIFNLEEHAADWKQQEGFGPKSVSKLLAAIAESKNCELYQFISAIGIPHISINFAKRISEHEKDWESFRQDINSNFDFSQWYGFGYEINKAIHNFDYKEADYIASNILTLNNNMYSDKKVEDNLKDLTFCITGTLKRYKNRTELQTLIESYGGKVVSGVSKNVNYLINNDINSTSSKNIKAKQLNIPIISEDEFMYKLLESRR